MKRQLIETLILLVGVAVFILGVKHWEYKILKAACLSGMVVSALYVGWCQYIWRKFIKKEQAETQSNESPWLLCSVIALGVFAPCMIGFMYQVEASMIWWVVGIGGWFILLSNLLEKLTPDD